MSTVKELLGTSNQAFTITLTSLADAAARESTVVDNSSNLFLDALVFFIIKTGAGALATVPFVNIYAYGTADGGTTYTDGASGSNAGITLISPPNLKIVGIGSTPSSAVSYKIGPFSIAAAFGGVLPEKWGVVVENKTGQAFDASIASGFYQGVSQQIT